MLSTTVAIGCVWLFKVKFIQIQYNEPFCSPRALALCQVLNSHVWLVVAVQDGTDIEHLYAQRKVYWMVQDYPIQHSLSF